MKNIEFSWNIFEWPWTSSLEKGQGLGELWPYDFLIDYGPILPKNIGSILSDKLTPPPFIHFWWQMWKIQIKKNIWMTFENLPGERPRARRVWTLWFCEKHGFQIFQSFRLSPGMMPNRHFGYLSKNDDLSLMPYIGIEYFVTYEVMIIPFLNTRLHKYPVWCFSMII